MRAGRREGKTKRTRKREGGSLGWQLRKHRIREMGGDGKGYTGREKWWGKRGRG